MAGEEKRFAYHRSVAPMLWLLVSVALVELAVTHALLSWWHPALALGLSLASGAGVLWLIFTIASMRTLPVLLDDERLLMRTGRLRSVTLDRRSIAGLRKSWTGEDIKDRRTLNLALIAYPNVVVDLVAPLPGRRGIMAVAHRLDDPAAFAAALQPLGRRRD